MQRLFKQVGCVREKQNQQDGYEQHCVRMLFQIILILSQTIDHSVDTGLYVLIVHGDITIDTLHHANIGYKTWNDIHTMSCYNL